MEDSKIDKWIYDFITPHKNHSFCIDDESKAILLKLKNTNNFKVRDCGDSGTNSCGCCDGYFEEYYLIFLDGDKKPKYHVKILYLEDQDDDITLTIDTVRN